MIIRFKKDDLKNWRSWVKVVFGINLNKSNFGKVMDFIWCVGLFLLGSYAWLVEKPRVELYNTCNKLIAMQWEKTHGYKLPDQNMSWENLSVSCPCLSSEDEVIK